MTDEELRKFVREVAGETKGNIVVADFAVAVARKAVVAERIRISHLWAGCTTEAEGHGMVDIGLSIREGKLVDAL